MPMRGGGTAGGGKSKQGLSYIPPSEPAFLKRIKEQIGYKAPATIDDKRAPLPAADDEDGSVADLDREEDGPTIVQLKDDDLSAEQVEEIRKEQKEKDEVDKINKGEGFVFRKPTKRPATDESSTSKEPDAIDIAEKSRARDEATPPTKKPTDARLLSFQDDEEDEDDD